MVVVVGGRYCRVLQQLTMHTGHLVGDKMCEHLLLPTLVLFCSINNISGMPIKSLQQHS